MKDRGRLLSVESQVSREVFLVIRQHVQSTDMTLLKFKNGKEAYAFNPRIAWSHESEGQVRFRIEGYEKPQ